MSVESQLLHILRSSLVMHLEKRWKIDKGNGALYHMGDQEEFLTSGFALVHH